MGGAIYPASPRGVEQRKSNPVMETVNSFDKRVKASEQHKELNSNEIDPTMLLVPSFHYHPIIDYKFLKKLGE